MLFSVLDQAGLLYFCKRQSNKLYFPVVVIPNGNLNKLSFDKCLRTLEVKSGRLVGQNLG